MLIAKTFYIDNGQYIPLENVNLLEGNHYIFFTLEEDDKVVFESSGELLDMLWFILLQVMEGALKGADEWTFPSLLRMERVGENVTLMTDIHAVTYPIKELYPALLNGFTQFMTHADAYFKVERAEHYTQMQVLYEGKVRHLQKQIT